MNWEDLKGLKYYAIYCLILIGFFFYSGIVGWKWFNPTSTETGRSPGGRPGHYFRYHK